MISDVVSVEPIVELAEAIAPAFDFHRVLDIANNDAQLLAAFVHRALAAGA